MSCQANYPRIKQKDLESLGKLIGDYPFDYKEWKRQFTFYEKQWKEYFTKIFLPIIKKEKSLKSIDLIIWESCPGGMVFPHPNYAFNNLSAKVIWPRDRFLIEAAKKAYNASWEVVKTEVTKVTKKQPDEVTKKDLLQAISTKGYLIIDLLPTHGFVMKNIRKKILNVDDNKQETHGYEGLQVLRKHWKTKNQFIESNLPKGIKIENKETTPLVGTLEGLYNKINPKTSTSVK